MTSISDDSSVKQVAFDGIRRPPWHREVDNASSRCRQCLRVLLINCSPPPRARTQRVHLLLSHGVKPYLVFDGGYLPAKAGKEEERRARRESNLQRGMQLMREGNASGAHQFFCKAADVTPFMAHQVIQARERSRTP